MMWEKRCEDPAIKHAHIVSLSRQLRLTWCPELHVVVDLKTLHKFDCLDDGGKQQYASFRSGNRRELGMRLDRKLPNDDLNRMSTEL